MGVQKQVKHIRIANQHHLQMSELLILQLQLLIYQYVIYIIIVNTVNFNFKANFVATRNFGNNCRQITLANIFLLFQFYNITSYQMHKVIFFFLFAFFFVTIRGQSDESCTAEFRQRGCAECLTNANCLFCSGTLIVSSMRLKELTCCF
jgi:hypothetical protein